MLVVIAVIGNPFLPAVSWIVGPVKVEDDVLGDAVPLPLLEVEPDESNRQTRAVFAIHGVLQAREGGLTGQVCLMGQATTDELQEWIETEGVGIVLILVTTGDLKDPLANQRFQRVVNRTRAPLGNTGRQRRTEPERSVGFGEPAEPTITGELGTIKSGIEG